MRKILVANCFSPNATAIRAVMADGKALAPPRRKILVAAGTLCPGSVANVLLDTIESLPDYHFLIWVAPGQEQSAATTAHRYWRALGETKPENFSFLTSSREADALAQEIRATFLHLFTEDMWFLRWSLERDIPIVTFSHSVSYFEDYPSLANPGDRNVVWQRRAMLYARKVVCWSELEKSFICRFLPIVSEKVKIVPSLSEAAGGAAGTSNSTTGTCTQGSVCGATTGEAKGV